MKIIAKIIVSILFFMFGLLFLIPMYLTLYFTPIDSNKFFPFIEWYFEQWYNIIDPEEDDE